MRQRQWRGRRVCALAMVAAGVVWLSACSGDATPASDPTKAVQGTAALVGPVAGGDLSLTCVVGQRSAVTDDAGRYKIDATGMTWPCTLVLMGGKVDGQENPSSLGTAVAAPGVANLTPWTHLVAARLLGNRPNLASLSPNELKAALAPAKIAEAQAGVRAEVVRLIGDVPAALDPVTTPFNATAGDGMRELLARLATGLRWTAKTLPQAAEEIARGPLRVADVPKTCRPAVLTGYAGSANDVPVQVAYAPAADAGDGLGSGVAGGDPGAGGGPGAGAGGSPGQFRNALVRVERVDGSLLGEAVTDGVKGMVTVVPCRYLGPVHLTVRARADGSSRFRDDATGKDVAFPPGLSMNAAVPSAGANIGVTLLTEAAWQYLQARHGAEGWRDPAALAEATAAVGNEVNKFLPKDDQVDDITRLPMPAASGKAYGAVSSGLARAAGLMRQGDPAPSLKLVRQFGRDLCDGTLDLACNGIPVVDDAKDAAYLPSQFGEALNRGVGQAAASCGAATSAEAAFRVTQVAVPSLPTVDPNGRRVVLDAYGDDLPLVLLRADGHAFLWRNRQSPAEPYLPELSFSRIFPQSALMFSGLTALGEFVSTRNLAATTPSASLPAYAGATTVAGYSYRPEASSDLAGYQAMIVRLPSGRASYFPHFGVDRVGEKEARLGNIVSVGVAANGRYLHPGAGPENRPTFFAVTADGLAYAWGNNAHGALGNGQSGEKGAGRTGDPERVLGLPLVTSVTGRLSGAFALDRSGHVWAWGAASLPDPDTQLPQPLSQGLLATAARAASPDAAPTASSAVRLKDFDPFGPVQQISCAVEGPCLALTRSGRLVAWGQFGDPRRPDGAGGPKEVAVTGVPLPSSHRITLVGASHRMVYAVLDDGRLVVFPGHPTVPRFIDLHPVLPALDRSACGTP